MSWLASFLRLADLDAVDLGVVLDADELNGDTAS
jgi:hypothetical protein